MREDSAGVSIESFRRWQDESRRLEELQIVFVVGPPKSGTTWLMATLGGHPEATACHESHVANELLPRLRLAVRDYSAQRAAWEYTPDAEPERADVRRLSRQVVDRVLLRAVAAGERGGRDRALRAVVEKTPVHAMHVDELAELYPWAKFVLSVRDVRDCAVSGWHHLGTKGRIDQSTIEEWAMHYAVDIWAPCVHGARAAGERLGPSRFIEIAYDDHKNDPAGQVRRLAEFVGLDADEASVRACLEAGDFKKLSGGREPGTAPESWSFFRKGVSGDWRNHLSQEFGDRLLRATAPKKDETDHEKWLRECLWDHAARRCAERGFRRIALYGAGAHTEAMLGRGWPGMGVELEVILDDAPTRPELRGVPVRLPDGAPATVQAVVVSSDVHEERLAAAAERSLGGRGLPVIRIYEARRAHPYAAPKLP